MTFPMEDLIKAVEPFADPFGPLPSYHAFRRLESVLTSAKAAVKSALAEERAKRQAERTACDERVKAARREALEEAARVADVSMVGLNSYEGIIASDIAYYIRVLQADDTGTTQEADRAAPTPQAGG